MSGLSALLAAAAVLVLRPPWGVVRVRIRGLRRARPPLRALRVMGVFLVVGSVVLLPPAPTILAWTTVTVLAVAWRRRAKARERSTVGKRRDRCHLVLDGLVAELRAGAPPAAAVQRLADEEPELTAVAGVAARGGDVVAALRAAGSRPGGELLGTVAAAWAVSEQTGAALAAVLERVRDAAREDRELGREVAAGVGPARATAALMIAMPPLGLALGSGLGVDPVAVVTGTLPGALCVAAGTAFAIAGVVWIDRVADRVEGQR